MDALKDLVKRFLSLEIVVFGLKSSIRWYVVVSLKCRVYSVWNLEMGTRAHPMLLLDLVRRTSSCVVNLLFVEIAQKEPYLGVWLENAS